LLEFFYLTPLPGSVDHHRLVKAGTALDSDLNKYDLNHVTTAHPRMSREEWERTCQGAWQRYYTIDHIETVLRRVASVGANASNTLFPLTWFKGSIDFEKMHPLECGFSAMQVPPRSTTWLPDRAGLALLSEVPHRDRCEPDALDLVVPAAAAPLSAHQT
jgi:hypothetical protein